MLVLSRKKDQSIVINDNVTITIIEIRGDKVRLGVDAPKEVPVHRQEVYDAIKRNDVNPLTEGKVSKGGQNAPMPTTPRPPPPQGNRI